MNVDVTEQSPQQAAQNQQQTHQQDTATVVALLISPSSASSPTSTVSPTASSISKNSSTDEVDETTAEAADLHSSESFHPPPRDVGQRPSEQPIDERQQPTDATLAGEHQHVVARQEERYQRSSVASVPSSIAGTAEEDGATSARTMTFAAASKYDGGGLETTDHTLLAQCTTVGNVTVAASEKDDQPVGTRATVAIDDDVLDSLNKRMSSAEITDNDTTTTSKTDVVREQELTVDTAIPQQSTSSSPGTVEIGEAKEVVALADSSLPTATVLAAANNNPMPDEDNEDEQADSSSSSNSSSTDTSNSSSTSGSSNSTNTSSGSSSINNNDRFNNNNNNNTNCSTGHKKEETESGDIDCGGKVKVGTACDNDSSLRIEKEEGVRTSTATEIAPGQGEGSSSSSSSSSSGSVTLPNAELGSGMVLVTPHEAAPAAPLDRVQILPETMDHSKHEEQVSEAADHDDGDDNDEGVGLSSMTVTTPTVLGEVAEENNTINTASSSAIVVAVGVGGGDGGTSLSSPSCTRATPAVGPLGDGSSSSATLPSSRSVSPSSSSSSESSPSATVPRQALAEAQQAAPPMADRQLCDSSPKGHSFVVGVVEGQRSKTTAEVPPSSRSPHPQQSTIGTEANPLISMHPSTTTHLAVVVEDDGGDRDDDTPHAPSNSRPLTLAEELSQADAAGSLASSSSSTSSSSVSPSVVAPGSASSNAAVVAVLPKSAAGTAVAAVAASSGSSRSTSPILHSSLKKSHRMGGSTGMAVTGPAGAAATAVATNEIRRRVSFPKDAQLITGYLDPVNPWACISVCESSELLELYRSSCKRHCTLPLKNVLEHLKSIDISKGRVPLLSLKDQQLSYGACEALEEIFKHVQYRCIDLSHSGLDDVTASVMFDIIEYYEAANELDISDNLQLSSKSWTACINMLKKSQALNVLITRGPTISDYQATNLAKALNTSAIHTLKLEHCVLSQQPIASLCSMLKRNTVLRELWLAHNQLSCEDAQQIANLLRSNYYIQLIDISNNRIGDKGVDHIVTAIVEQSIYFKDMQEKKRKSDLNFSDLSSSLNSINNGEKNYFPHRIRSSEPIAIAGAQHQQVISSDDDMRCPPSAITLTPPVTPPSTPALPAITTPTGDPPRTDRSEKMETAQVSEAGKTATMYTINQHGVGIESKANHDTTTPPPAAPSPPTPPADAVAPPNVNLVQTSTNNSVSLQTSDREKPATVERPTVGGMVTAEEEALLLSSVGVVVGERPTEVPSTTDSEVKVQSERTVDTTTTTEDESFELLLSLETTPSDSPVPQAPKKARLAKQDSVLSEFEATVAMDTTTDDGGKDVETEQKPKQAANSIAKQPMMPKVAMMEEDAPELCADYDDDGSNLQISQENLFVDLGIPAVCEEEEEVEDIERATGSAAVVVAPLKKDELQLLIEKSKKVDAADQLETAIEAEEAKEEVPVKEVPVKEQNAPSTTIAPPVVRARKSAISSDDRQQPLSSMPIQAPKKDRTHSSGSDNTVEGGATGVRIVEVEIKDSVPLSRSLDSVGGDESDFESSSPFMTTAPSSFPNERSFSSESLNSETSIDSNDSKSSLKIIESKFAAKNGTLERQQQSNGNRESTGGDQASSAPTGLQVLVLWNNEITRNSMRHFSRLLEKTSTLDTLNVGSNLLCNSFVTGIGAALKANGSLTNLGLQGAHLSDKGAKAMAEVIEFGGNASLQRIDLRNNNIQKAGLEALNEAMKSNKSVTRIDLDDTPRRVKDTSIDGVGSEYSRLVNNIRAQCERNKNPPEPSEPINASVKRARANYLSSRKISLTCPSIVKTSPSAISGADKQHLLDPSGCKKTPPGTTGTGGGRLRSPLPSPIPSPIASPVPSPSRNRFHVSRVTDAASGGGTGGGSNPSGSPSPSSTGSSPTLFFPSNSRFRVVTVAEPDLKSANNRNSGSTISLPMSSSKSSPSVSPSLSMAASVGSSAMAVHRRPVCSSAPTLSSFPSPQSPLAGVPTTMGVRSMIPSPVPPPPLVSVVMPSNTTFGTSIQHTPLMATPPMGQPSSAMIVPTLVGPTLVNQTMPLQPQILSQSPFQQLPPVAPFTQHPTTPQGYHFGTMCRPGNNTPITIQQQQQQQPQLHPSPVMFHQLTKNTATSQQQQQQQQTQYTSALPPTKVRHSSSSSSHHHLQQHHSSSSNSSTLHDSVLSSTSIESPDLEVKRFMSGSGGGGGGGVLDDSCCSSISSSSIDSIDNPHFISTSISSTDESFDLVVSSPPPSGGGSSCSSFSIVPSQTSRPQEEESTLIPSASGGGGHHPVGRQTGAASLEGGGQQPPIASLSTSSIGAQLNTASSQESLYDVHDLSASSNSSLTGTGTGTVTVNWMQQGQAAGGIKHQAAPIPHHAAPPIAANLKAAAHLASSNSNESTLTSVQSLDREPAMPAKVQPAGEKAPRVRKTSWILGGVGGGTCGGGSKHTDSGSSGGSTPTPSGGGSGYPPAIEKLLSIFHNPFSSSSKASSASPPPHATESSASSGGSQPPSRKESPMGGLFHWAHGSGGGSNSTSPTTTTSSNASSSVKKEDDQRLKENVSPETTLTPQQLQPLQNQLQTTGISVQHQQQSAENMPPQLKVEMKENISPENTITHKLLTAVVPSAGETVVLAASNLATPAIVTPATAAPHTKVIFQLGGDYDESEDDIETLTNKYGNNASLGGVGGGQYFGTGGHHQSGPSSLLGGSTTSNSSGISIGSGTSAGGDIPITTMVPSPTPSGASVVSGQTSVSSDTVLVLSHLGQLARDSLSMFKNPSLTSQDSISVRSMDSLMEMAIEVTKPTPVGGGGAAPATGRASAAADTQHPPSASPLPTVPGHSTQSASASASSPSSLSLGHTASSRSSSPSEDNSSAH